MRKKCHKKYRYVVDAKSEPHHYLGARTVALPDGRDKKNVAGRQQQCQSGRVAGEG